MVYCRTKRKVLVATVMLLLIVRCVSAVDIWFPVGEQLFHKIYWGFIPVGRSVTTTRMTQLEGKPYIQIRMRTRTNSFFDKIRRVDDVVESIVDPDTFLPVSFHRKMIRRKEACNEYTVFNRLKLQGDWENRCTGEKKSFALAEDTKDILTFLYYMRQAQFKVNSVGAYRVMADEGLFALQIKGGKNEDVDLPLYGKVKSLRIDPVFAFDGLLVKGGKFYLWVSADDRHLLTRAKIKRKLADINVILQKVAGPGDDMWTKTAVKRGHSITILNDEEVEAYLSGENPWQQ